MQAYRPVRMAALGRRVDVQYRKVLSKTDVTTQPLKVGADMLGLFGLRDDLLPSGERALPPYPSAVFMISKALVFSSSGIIALPSGEVLEDTLDHTLPQIDGFRNNSDGSVSLGKLPRRETGKFLSLLLGAYDNHFHWLVMNLARVALLSSSERHGLDGVLVPADLTGTQLEALEATGICRLAPLRFVGRGESLQVDTLILPWNVGGGKGNNPDGINWLRSLFRAA